jgi:SAM-dependent methyltransferase
MMSKLDRRVREAILAIARPLFHVGVRASPHIAGKLRPLAERSGVVVQKRGELEDVPPPALWVGYADNAEDYVACGREDMASVIALLERNGIELPKVALDLGCAAARMTRHFPRTADSEIWGADLSAPHINWCQRNLPELNFVTVSTAPHLPFPDGYFDFVFCASVFTHMTDLADAWLLEIRRVLKPRGHLYMTIHDKISIEEMQTIYADGVPTAAAWLRLLEQKHGISGDDCEMVYFDADPASQVFYDREYITRKWGRWMRLLAYEERFHNYQAALLFEKNPA